jgi:hypothetical protein
MNHEPNFLPPDPKVPPLAESTSGGAMTMKGGEQFEWDVLVPHVIHPAKVAIIEALLWVDQPLSASDLAKLIGSDKCSLAHISYHLVQLAKAGALEVVRSRQVRGATEKFYFFA